MPISVPSAAVTQNRFQAIWHMLFFRGDTEVLAALDVLVWQRTQIYMYTTASLVAIWGAFDFLMDFENLWFYLALRAIYTPITFLIAFNFHRPFFKNHHKEWAMVHYILLIIDIGIMVLWTDNFVKYLIGFSTIFWGAGILMLWRFWYTVVPGLIVIVIAFLRFYFLPHNLSVNDFVTGLYYFLTCLVFSSVLSSVGYFRTYEFVKTQLDLKKSNLLNIQTARLSSMNMVVAGVAHEINTPIGTAHMALSHACDELRNIKDAIDGADEVNVADLEQPAERALESLTTAQQELARTSKLITKFKHTAVDQSIEEKREFDLVAYIKENIIKTSLRNRLKHVEVKVTGLDSLVINSYPGEFSQIFLNLVTNTIDHGYAGRDLQQKPGKITITVSTPRSTRLQLQYHDDGHGLSPEVLPRIFEPFFTTKGQAGHEGRGHSGSGLGLAIVYNAVTQRLHGTIDASSHINNGAMFSITLPIERVNKEARQEDYGQSETNHPYSQRSSEKPAVQ